MKVELKSIKVMNSLSDETTCFTAKIYINGKAAGHAENRGCGGSTHYQFNDHAIGQLFETYAASLPPTLFSYGGQDHSFPSTGESLIDSLLNDHLKAKDAARLDKMAAKEKARFAAAGLITLKMKSGDQLLFVGCKPGAEATAASRMNEKYKTTWTWETI